MSSTSASSDKGLRQRLDRDISALIENFAGLVKSSRVSDAIKNHQERLEMGVHAAQIVSAGDSLLELVAELKLGAVLSDYHTINRNVQQRVKGFDQLSDKAEDVLETIVSEASEALQELEAVYYAGDPRWRGEGASGGAERGGATLTRLEEIAMEAPDC